MYSADGRLLAEYAAEKRVFVPIGSIPPRLAEAFLSAEDKKFYEHSGIDTTGVIRAIVTNLENFGGDRRLVGARPSAAGREELPVVRRGESGPQDQSHSCFPNGSGAIEAAHSRALSE